MCSKDKNNFSYGGTEEDRVCEGFVKAPLDELECSYEDNFGHVIIKN